jgi:hypothetical protein
MCVDLAFGKVALCDREDVNIREGKGMEFEEAYRMIYDAHEIVAVF